MALTIENTPALVPGAVLTGGGGALTVRIMRTCRACGDTVTEGQVVTMPEADARDLIKHRRAEIAEPPPPVKGK